MWIGVWRGRIESLWLFLEGPWGGVQVREVLLISIEQRLGSGGERTVVDFDPLASQAADVGWTSEPKLSTMDRLASRHPAMRNR